MATHPDYKYVSSFVDRHGVTRWRYRNGTKTVSLRGQPGDYEFELDYKDVVEGRPKQKPRLKRQSANVSPGTFLDAWIRVKRTVEWQRFDPATTTKYSKLAEQFLSLPLIEGGADVWGEMPVADFRRRHVKEILARFATTPHKAKHLLVTLRKMLRVALDEEWIEFDPSHQISYRPEYKGWRAWSEAERQQYEARWPIGSTPRTAYGLALWLGNRRSDIAKVKWADIDRHSRTFRVVQKKGDKELVLPISPMLEEILLPLNDTKHEYVLVTAYGRPFSAKSLTGMMAHWTKLAGMMPGCTLHGLRKTLGKLMAEAGSSTRQLMETLGHDDIAHAELYSREAEQARLARDGMEKLSEHLAYKNASKRRG